MSAAHRHRPTRRNGLTDPRPPQAVRATRPFIKTRPARLPEALPRQSRRNSHRRPPPDPAKPQPDPGKAARPRQSRSPPVRASSRVRPTTACSPSCRRYVRLFSCPATSRQDRRLTPGTGRPAGAQWKTVLTLDTADGNGQRGTGTGRSQDRTTPAPTRAADARRGVTRSQDGRDPAQHVKRPGHRGPQRAEHVREPGAVRTAGTRLSRSNRTRPARVRCGVAAEGAASWTRIGARPQPRPVLTGPGSGRCGRVVRTRPSFRPVTRWLRVPRSLSTGRVTPCPDTGQRPVRAAPPTPALWTWLLRQPTRLPRHGQRTKGRSEQQPPSRR